MEFHSPDTPKSNVSSPAGRINPQKRRSAMESIKVGAEGTTVDQLEITSSSVSLLRTFPTRSLTGHARIRSVG
jgi:hypothetical protein